MRAKILHSNVFLASWVLGQFWIAESVVLIGPGDGVMSKTKCAVIEFAEALLIECSEWFIQAH